MWLMAMPVPPDSQFVAVVGDGQCAGDATDAAAAFGVLPGEMVFGDDVGDTEALIRGRACGGVGDTVGFQLQARSDLLMRSCARGTSS